MRRHYFFILGVFIILAGCRSKKDDAPMDRAIPVRTVRVEQKELSRPIHTSGRLSSSTEMKLSFKIGGIIEKLFGEGGERVEEGQILAALKLDEIQAQVTLARSAFEKAKRDHGRVKNLYADSVATLEQLQDAETGMEVARSQLAIAEFNLKHSSIVAPENGRILKKLAEKNELVGPGHPVYFFGTGGREWLVRVGVVDQDVVRLSLGDSALVTFDAYRGVAFPGIVVEIAGAPDPMNGTFEVELTIQQGKYRLVNGFIARVDIFPSQKKWLHVIPFEAIVEADGNKASVFQPCPEDRARKLPVTIEYLMDDRVAVSRGLENVECVITEGSAYLRDGASIRIIENNE